MFQDSGHLNRYNDGLRAERPWFDSRQGKYIFLFFTASSTVLGPIKPPIQWIPKAISQGVKRPGMKLTTHLRLMPRSRMAELYLHSPICLHGILLN
jgi:hypothetical protein